MQHLIMLFIVCLIPQRIDFETLLEHLLTFKYVCKYKTESQSIKDGQLSFSNLESVYIRAEMLGVNCILEPLPLCGCHLSIALVHQATASSCF